MPQRPGLASVIPRECHSLLLSLLSSSPESSLLTASTFTAVLVDDHPFRHLEKGNVLPTLCGIQDGARVRQALRDLSQEFDFAVFLTMLCVENLGTTVRECLGVIRLPI